MKKIKNFKINFRQREIIRYLKSTAKNLEITNQIEEAVKQESQRIQKFISPAAIYDTFSKSDIADQFNDLMPKSYVASSFYLVTINDKIEQEIKEAQRRGENILSEILHSLSLEALEQSTNFIQRLINEEAKNEGYELLQRQNADSSPVWEKIFNFLPNDKIGVQLFENNVLQPIYSSCGFIPWIPLKKQGSKNKV